MTADAATALLSMSSAATRADAVLWAGIAVLRGATAEEAHQAVELWDAARQAEVQTVVAS